MASLQQGASSAVPIATDGAEGGAGTPETIFQAARTGDAEFIQSAIMNGEDVNTKDSDGERWDAPRRIPGDDGLVTVVKGAFAFRVMRSV